MLKVCLKEYVPGTWDPIKVFRTSLSTKPQSQVSYIPHLAYVRGAQPKKQSIFLFLLEHSHGFSPLTLAYSWWILLVMAEEMSSEFISLKTPGKENLG